MKFALENDEARGQAGLVGDDERTQRPTFCFPSPSAVKGRVLGALLAGEIITHLDCWRRFGSARLAHHAYVLRGIGWPVQMEERTVTTSDGRRSAIIGNYFLPRETIAAAGERAQTFAAECARINAERRAA